MRSGLLIVKHWLAVLVLCVVCCSCEDTTGVLGNDMMPVTDLVTTQYQTHQVYTASYAVGDSVLARTSTCYLGRYTDPETGTAVKSDFLAQFHSAEGFSFPDSVENHEITAADLRLYISDFVGDSLANFKLSVYPLNKILDADQNYYTNINPASYYDTTAAPIATKWFSISDRTISDSLRWSKNYNANIHISLPKEIGQAIYDGYRANPALFENTETWLNSNLPCSKGFYFKLEAGDGAMAYIDVAQFNLYFKYYDQDFAKDTTGVNQFACTEEVIQATRFENSKLNTLLENQDVTYVKSPAGIFTMATLPTDEININDTINYANLTFKRYNDLVDSRFKLAIPKQLLLVRLDDYENGFFEKYSLADNQTSYLASFNASSNTYEFTNISRLLMTILQEKQNGTATENADKVLLIPVSTTYDSSSNLVKLSHDFSLASAKLVGGANHPIELKVIYSRYQQ